MRHMGLLVSAYCYFRNSIVGTSDRPAGGITQKKSLRGQEIEIFQRLRERRREEGRGGGGISRNRGARNQNMKSLLFSTLLAVCPASGLPKVHRDAQYRLDCPDLHRVLFARVANANLEMQNRKALFSKLSVAPDVKKKTLRGVHTTFKSGWQTQTGTQTNAHSEFSDFYIELFVKFNQTINTRRLCKTQIIFSVCAWLKSVQSTMSLFCDVRQFIIVFGNNILVWYEL